jgi:hypothetical protein
MIGHLVPALNEEKTRNFVKICDWNTLLRLGYDGLVISDALNMHSQIINKRWNGKLSMLEKLYYALFSN